MWLMAHTLPLYQQAAGVSQTTAQVRRTARQNRCTRSWCRVRAYLGQGVTRMRSVLPWLAPLLLLAVSADAEPLPDVPRDHHAAWAVATLWRIGVIRGEPDGLFHGDRRITEDEAVAMSARLGAAIQARFILGEGHTIGQVLERWRHEAVSVEACPVAHWALPEWIYLMRVRPVGTPLLDGWPDPLPTRYEAAVAAATVYKRVKQAYRDPLARQLRQRMNEAAASEDMMPLDWMPRHEAMEPNEELEGPPLTSP